MISRYQISGTSSECAGEEINKSSRHRGLGYRDYEGPLNLNAKGYSSLRLNSASKLSIKFANRSPQSTIRERFGM